MNYDRKTVKQRARGQVKRHYLLLVVLCAVSMFLGTEFTGLVDNAQTWYDVLTGQETRLAGEGISDDLDRLVKDAAEDTSETPGEKKGVLDSLFGGDLEVARRQAEERIAAMQQETDPHSALGRTRGIFAAVANNISSGHLSATLGAALNSVVRSRQVVGVIMVLVSAAFYAAVWVFLRNMYRAVLRRAFLETRTYEAFPLGHLLHFRLVRRWNRAALTLLLQAVYQTLWDLTLVGGVIKHYSYFLVPFIVAENPDIRPREAVTLSRRMMDGHKWECFKLELSFLGWNVLGFVTFGAVDALWAVPYEMATRTEYYALLRREARDKGLEGAEALNDDCLFEAADPAVLRRHYAEVTRIEGVLDEDIVELPPVKRFFARNFGIWVGSLTEKRIFSRQAGLRQQTLVARMEMEGRAYPERVNRLWNRKEAEVTGRVSYLAPCTVWSLVAVFFAFCVFGWVWEVSLHLISDGEFVNRGMLHGPWLPIYGGGVVMIAVLLYRFRRKPVVEAILVVLVCGFVEYMTSYLTELSRGMRWWDYTGYFLNLNGRICGEGLAVFAVGGMAAIYFLVPLIDGAITRVKPKILIPVCIALLVIFGADLVYSHYVPNMGKGITDYGQQEALPPADADTV